MLKMAVQRGRSERRGESYSVPYGEPLSDATCLREALRRRQGTKLADFFSILLAFCASYQVSRFGQAPIAGFIKNVLAIIGRSAEGLS
jgi:hypothetical protein